ncbi:MAG: PDZ domain-containing protein [Gemmataceae bacterium]
MTNAKRFLVTATMMAFCAGAALAQDQPPQQQPQNQQQQQQPQQQQRMDRQSRPYIGVAVAPADHGIMVQNVTPDGPAAKAGLNNGDRILKVDDQDVTDAQRFIQTVAAKKAGDQVKMHIQSNNQEKDITITLGEWPMMQGQGQGGFMQGQNQGRGMPWQGQGQGNAWMNQFPGFRRQAFLGVQAEPLTPEMKQQMNIKADSGVVVREVTPNSPAAQAGIRQNDVITAVNDKAIRDTDQLRETVQQIGTGQEVTLHVSRGQETTTIKAKLAEPNYSMFGPQGNMQQFPRFDMGTNGDSNPRIRELEQRIAELEKRIRELESKQGSQR